MTKRRGGVIFDMISNGIIFKEPFRVSLDVNASWAVRVSRDVRVVLA